MQLGDEFTIFWEKDIRHLPLPMLLGFSQAHSFTLPMFLRFSQAHSFTLTDKPFESQVLTSGHEGNEIPVQIRNSKKVGSIGSKLRPLTSRSFMPFCCIIAFNYYKIFNQENLYLLSASAVLNPKSMSDLQKILIRQEATDSLQSCACIEPINNTGHLQLSQHSREINERNLGVQQIQEQETYSSQAEYLFSIIGFAVGYGSFWRFPYLVYEHGSEFIFIYFCILIALGLPILYLEATLGQMHQLSLPFLFGRINRGLKVLGLTFVLICFHFSAIYNVILAYSYRFVVSVFDTGIHFEDESIRDNKIFGEVILHSSPSIEDFGGINWSLFAFYALSLGMCYLIVKEGVKQSGKIIVFTATFPYVLFCIMLIRGLFLPGASEGLQYLFEFKGNLLDFRIWFEATIQVFYQLTLACSGIVHMSSMKPRDSQFLSGLALILLSVLTCGVLCAANIFVYLGHFANQIGVGIDEITLSGPQICFNIFPKALAILPMPRVWLFLFFVTMVLLGIDTMIGALESIICYLKDQFKFSHPVLLGRKLTLQELKLGLVCAYVLFIFTLTSEAGIHYLLFYDRFSVYVPLALNMCLEVYFFVHRFPLEELQQQIWTHTGTRTPSYVKVVLKSQFLIAILGLNLALTIYSQLLLFEEYSFGFFACGWMVTLYPYIWAAIYWSLYRQKSVMRLTFQDVNKLE